VTSTAPSTIRAYRFLDFCKTYQVGKDRAYADIRSGALIARKVGKNTIILVDDAEAYIASLPRLELPPNHGLARPAAGAAGSTLAIEGRQDAGPAAADSHRRCRRLRPGRALRAHLVKSSI